MHRRPAGSWRELRISKLATTDKTVRYRDSLIVFIIKDCACTKPKKYERFNWAFLLRDLSKESQDIIDGWIQKLKEDEPWTYTACCEPQVSALNANRQSPSKSKQCHPLSLLYCARGIKKAHIPQISGQLPFPKHNFRCHIRNAVHGKPLVRRTTPVLEFDIIR